MPVLTPLGARGRAESGAFDGRHNATSGKPPFLCFLGLRSVLESKPPPNPKPRFTKPLNPLG